MNRVRDEDENGSKNLIEVILVTYVRYLVLEFAWILVVAVDAGGGFAGLI